MKRRTLLTAAAASLAVSPRSTHAQASPVTLQVWSWQNAQAPIYAKIFAAYEAANPGVKIAYRGFVNTDYPTVLKTGLSGAGGPDVVMLHPYRSIAPYVRAGQLAPLDPAAIPELTNFSPDSLAAARLDGKLWGLPFARQSVQIFTNQKLLASLGVAPPTAPGDLVPMLDKIAGAGITPFAVTGKDSWQLVNVFDALVGNVYGGRAFLDKVAQGQASFTDPAMVEALSAFSGLGKYFPKFVSAVSMADSRALFASGKAAMFPGGSWELANFQASPIGADLGVFSMPGPVAGQPAPTWGYEDGSLGLSAQSEHPHEALALLRWMATPAFGQAFTDQLKQPSSIIGVAPHDPLLARMVGNLQANPVPMVWVTEYFGVSSPAPYAALMNAAQKLLSGSTTPAEAATSIAQSVTEWNALQK